MAKQSLLVVDGDTRSLRLLEVSLRKAGYQVTTAINGADALSKIEMTAPDLIISDTHMAEMDGFEFCKRVKQNSTWSSIPFIFLTDQRDVEDKIHGLELGVDDYLTKPIYLKEIVSRVQILLEKHQQRGDSKKGDTRTKFHGHLQDMAVVDLIQTIEIGRKSGVIHFGNKEGRTGAIYFRNGKVIDAELGKLLGEDAVYRLLNWTDGEFDLEFKPIRRRDVIELSSQGLLMEGMRRVDEWSRLCEQIPPLDSVLEVDPHELADRLADLPDELNGVLRLFDGRRTILDVVDDCEFGDLEALNIVSRLYFDGLIGSTSGAKKPRGPKTEPPRDTNVPEFIQEIPVSLADDDELLPLSRPLGNVIRFPSPPGAVPIALPQQRLPTAWGMAAVAAGRAPSPNDLLQPVAGETEHLSKPEPHLPEQPPVIVQREVLGDDARREARELKEVREPPPPPIPVPIGEAYERTERIEAVAAPKREPLLPYFLSGGLIAAGLLIGYYIVEGVRVPDHPKPPPSREAAQREVILRPPQRAPLVEPGAPPDLGRPGPSSPSKPPPLLAGDNGGSQGSYDGLLAQARASYKKGAMKRANQLLDQAHQLRPGRAEALALQALIALGDGRQGRAAELAKKALDIDETSAEAHLVLGTVDQEAESLSQARAHYERYLQLDPHGEMADEVRAILRRLGN